MSRHTARNDDDSWDLASSVGATATMVATSRANGLDYPDAAEFAMFSDVTYLRAELD